MSRRPFIPNDALRRLAWLGLLGGVAFAATLAISPRLSAQTVGIRNSVHDLSRSGTGGKWGSEDTNQICIFCHAPHHAQSTSLLWNRDLPSGASFSLYRSDTMQMTPEQPKAASLRCLSCHDGSIAIDAFNAGRTWTPRMPSLGDIYFPGSPYGSGGANIGGNYGDNSGNNLTDDHPVSFIYDEAIAQADGQLASPTEVEAAGLPLYGNDPRGKTVECSTCHEVHRKYPYKWLLRIDVEDQSNLCLTCHTK